MCCYILSFPHHQLSQSITTALSPSPHMQLNNGPDVCLYTTSHTALHYFTHCTALIHTLHCTTLHTALHYFTHCTSLLYTLHCTTLHTALHYFTHCSTLLHTLHCTTLQHSNVYFTSLNYTPGLRYVLHFTALHCHFLHCSAPVMSKYLNI